MIGVGDDGLTHDLTCLVALARDQQNIASLEIAGRHCDGIGPACNLDRAGRRRHDSLPDHGGFLTSRVVISDVNVVGMSNCRASHFGTLSGVPVTAAAKNDV